MWFESICKAVVCRMSFFIRSRSVWVTFLVVSQADCGFDTHVLRKSKGVMTFRLGGSKHQD